MEHDLENTLALLVRTPAVLNALLRDLPQMWTERHEGENTWCARDVVAHLIHCEKENWIPRAKMIREFGETRPFVPLNREGHARLSRGKSLAQLLDEFAQARAEGLNELRAMKLTEEDMQRRGKHPALGAVTLSQLLATWAAHDLTHLHQITRVLAAQYRRVVGPWSRFLGVLACAGHSEPA
jgi:hypothetical protein